MRLGLQMAGVWPSHPVTGLVLRVAIGLLFLASGLGKVFHPQDFYQAVEAYQLTGPALTWWISQLLPWIEGVMGVYLLLGLWTQWVARALSLLLLGFLGVMAWMLLTGKQINCGCFVGVAPPEPISGLTLLRDGLIFLVVAWLGAIPKTHLALCEPSSANSVTLS